MTSPIQILPLESAADDRGHSFYIPEEAVEFLGAIAEIHYATIVPGAVRGNHYHESRREAIFLDCSGEWRLAWRPTRMAASEEREFYDRRGTLVLVEAGVAHAIENTGDELIRLVSFSDGRFDPDDPDTPADLLL